MDDLLENLFGDGENCDEDQHPIQPIAAVPGLYIAKTWISEAEQVSRQIKVTLINANKLHLALHSQRQFITALQQGYLRDGVNQGMHFGALPDWLTKISARMQGILPGPLWSRQPLFDSLILNKYRPGDGICAHVDLLRFEVSMQPATQQAGTVLRVSTRQVDLPCAGWHCSLVSGLASCYDLCTSCVLRPGVPGASRTRPAGQGAGELPRAIITI
jgi:hypothetical protein